MIRVIGVSFLKLHNMKSKLKKLVCVLTGCLVLSGSLSSCQGVEITGKAEDIPGYTEQEAMIVLGSERNRYQKVLGQEIWSVPVENQPETTYGPYFVNKVKDFLQDIKTLNLEATEKGIIATSTDMETIRKIAKEFYQGLSEEDIAFMGNCTEEDVQSIYTEYYVATKTAEYLLSKVSSEVSDADAKVITVQQIVVSDEALQIRFLKRSMYRARTFPIMREPGPKIRKSIKHLQRMKRMMHTIQPPFSLRRVKYRM